MNETKKVWWLVECHHDMNYPWERWYIHREEGTEEELQEKELEFVSSTYCQMCNDRDIIVATYYTLEEAEAVLRSREIELGRPV